MSDASYFDDALDSRFLDEVDALETKLQPTTRVPALEMGPSTSSRSFGTRDGASSARAQGPPSHEHSDPFGEVFDLDDLEEIGDVLDRGISGPSNPPTTLVRMGPKTLQTTLWGATVLESPTKSGATSRTQSTGERMRKTKTWDKTAFAKSGWKARRPEAKGKGKGRANDDEEEVEGEEDMLLEDTPDIPEYTSSEPSDPLLIFL
jgi:ATP-dependent DNA helicase MPH1